MTRELSMIIVADTNAMEAREVISQLSDNMSISHTVVTPQLVRNIIPIRANPAIGVMFWSNDLQGVASDVEAFSDYIKNEFENKQALADAEEVAQAYVDLLVETITTENGLEVE